MTTLPHIALEQQLDLLQFYSHPRAWEAVSEGSRMAGNTPDPQYAKMFCREVAYQAEYGVPYYVSADIVRTLQASLPTLPLTTTLSEDLLPSPVGFVYLEKGYSLRYTHLGLDIPLQGFGWRVAEATRDEKARLVLMFYGPAYNPKEPNAADGQWQSSGFYVGKFDETLEQAMSSMYDAWRSDGVPSENTDRVLSELAFVYAFLHFVNQRVVSLGESRAPREVRRRVERSGRQVPLIRTILLRARETTRSQREEGSGSWSVRSIRRAHWHHYWCGGKSSECLAPGHVDTRLELRWVEATVCGPEDAPLKEQAKLFAVVR